MATENKGNGLFEIKMSNENEIMFSKNQNNNEKLPITLFQEIETELLDRLLHDSDCDSEDETDGPIDFIRNVVETVKEDFDSFVEEGERKTFLHTLTKIFATPLSVKADNIEKVIRLVKLSVSAVIKTWSEQN